MVAAFTFISRVGLGNKLISLIHWIFCLWRFNFWILFFTNACFGFSGLSLISPPIAYHLVRNGANITNFVERGVKHPGETSSENFYSAQRIRCDVYMLTVFRKLERVFVSQKRSLKRFDNAANANCDFFKSLKLFDSFFLFPNRLMYLLFSCSEIFPYLVVVIGLENVLVLTKSVVSTPVDLEVKLRIAQGKVFTQSSF